MTEEAIVDRTAERDPRIRAPRAQIGIALRGGGVKGLALLGAVDELSTRLNADFIAFGGTSAGGLLALALAAGHSPKRLIEIVSAHSFTSFLDSRWFPNPDLDPAEPSDAAQRRGLSPRHFLRAMWRAGLFVLGARSTTGLFSTEPVGRWMQHLLRWRPTRANPEPIDPDLGADGTLGALQHDVMTVCASTGPRNLVFHSSRSTPAVDAVFAARATMAIPGVFSPLAEGGDYLFDGGLLANFPIEHFEEHFPGLIHIGVCLVDSGSHVVSDRTGGLLGIARATFAVFLGQDERVIISSGEHLIAWIDPTPIRTLDFDLDDADKRFLVTCGRLGAMRFLRDKELKLRERGVDIQALPSDAEYQALSREVLEMRKEARRRWASRHAWRTRLAALALLVPIVVTLGAVALASAFAGHTLSRVSSARPPGAKQAASVSLANPVCGFVLKRGSAEPVVHASVHVIDAAGHDRTTTPGESDSAGFFEVSSDAAPASDWKVEIHAAGCVDTVGTLHDEDREPPDTARRKQFPPGAEMFSYRVHCESVP